MIEKYKALLNTKSRKQNKTHTKFATQKAPLVQMALFRKEIHVRLEVVAKVHIIDPFLEAEKRLVDIHTAAERPFRVKCIPSRVKEERRWMGGFGKRADQNLLSDPHPHSHKQKIMRFPRLISPVIDIALK